MSGKKGVVAFRVDSSCTIGSGHLHRCVALAEQFRKIGKRPHFFMHPLAGNSSRLLDSLEFGYTFLSSFSKDFNSKNQREWLFTSIEKDASLFEKILPKQTELVVVDHYSLDFRWTERFYGKYKILCLDDLADRKLKCDFLLDQNIGTEAQKRYKNLANTDCRIFLGPEYTPFKSATFEFALKRKRIRRSIEKILVFFGSSDMAKLCEPTTKILLQSRFRDAEILVVTGESNSNFEKVSRTFVQNKNVDVIKSSDRFFEHLAEADLALGAMGSTAFERILFGLPTIGFVIADNQAEASKGVVDLGCSWAINARKGLDEAEFQELLESLSQTALESMSERCLQLFTPKNGAERLVEQIVARNSHR